MDNLEQRNRYGPIFSADPKPVDEKTLAELVKAVSLSPISISVATGSITGISEEQQKIINTPSIHCTQDLGKDWIIPNSKIVEEILAGNERNYIYTCCSLKTPDTTFLVLCKVSKDMYTDSSYKIRYTPLTADIIKRMPE